MSLNYCMLDKNVLFSSFFYSSFNYGAWRKRRMREKSRKVKFLNGISDVSMETKLLSNEVAWLDPISYSWFIYFDTMPEEEFLKSSGTCAFSSGVKKLASVSTVISPAICISKLSSLHIRSESRVLLWLTSTRSCSSSPLRSSNYSIACLF